MMSDLKLPLGSRCIKYLMFIFNFLFVITGIILLSIGASVRAIFEGSSLAGSSFNYYSHILDGQFLTVPKLLIAIGAIIFCVAFFGCCGAVRENYCMVLTFTFLMIVIFILELSGGIAGYVLKSDAKDLIRNNMYNQMKNYGQNGSVDTKIWDGIQSQWQCCGVNSSADWEKYVPSRKLPVSCCSIPGGSLGSFNCTLDDKAHVYPQGCLDAFGSYIKEHAVQLGGAGIGVAFVQALGIAFSIFLAKAIKMNYETV